MPAPQRVWMVRCEGGELFDAFIDKGVVAHGAMSSPDLTAVRSRQEIADRLGRAHDWPRAKLGRIAGSHARFRLEMTAGDRVLTYNPSLRRYKLGVLVGDYRYDPDLVDGKPHIRAVDGSTKSTAIPSRRPLARRCRR